MRMSKWIQGIAKAQRRVGKLRARTSREKEQRTDRDQCRAMAK
jgi:hypothetical protein